MSTLTLEEELEQAWLPENRPQYSDGLGRVWSKKQVECLRMGADPALSAWYIIGPWQCGKTESAIPGFLRACQTRFSGAQVAMFAKGRAQVGSVLKPRVSAYFAARGLEVEYKTDGYEYFDIPSLVGSAPIRVWLIVAGERGKTTQGASQTAERVQGMTLSAVYIDEITNCSPWLIEMLIGRMLTVKDSLVVATGNPDGPAHWLKTTHLDKIDDGTMAGKHVRFKLPDHPYLTKDQVADKMMGLRPHIRRRMELGEWAAAEGVIYPNYKLGHPEPGASVVYDVVLDYAPKRIGHVLLIAYADENVYVVDEFRTDARRADESTLDKQAKRIMKWLGSRTPRMWLVPVDAREFVPFLKGNGARNVQEPVQELGYGIGATGFMLESIMYVSKRCAILISELDSYAYHPERRDEPDKDSADGAHAVDALRYWCATFWRRRTLQRQQAPQRGKR